MRPLLPLVLSLALACTTVGETDDTKGGDGNNDDVVTDTGEVVDPGERDSDNDGLTNAEEAKLGTNPDVPDTDSDRLTDGDEVNVHETDPLDDDTDGDGLIDGDEVLDHKTDPLKADTDGDGLTDGDEVAGTTSPVLADTDGDGLTDGAEINEHETDPTKKDTDGDTLEDGDEISVHETDPTKADTDGDGLDDGLELGKHKTDPLKDDTDGDGLLDGDEVNKHLTDPNSDDTDKDGLTDFDEVDKHDTDPTNSDTDGDTLLDGDELGKLGTDPTKKDTDDDGLDDNVELSGDLDGDGKADFTPTLPTNPDTDGDDLKDGVEVAIKTDPQDTDTDDDGVDDGDEVLVHKSDPLVQDTDKDGLTDGQEVNQYETDPTKPDTDEDNLTDFEEVLTYETDPNDPDMDEDGLLDGDEIKTHGSDPENPDTDGDTLSDGVEVLNYKTDPTKEDTDGDTLSDPDEIFVHETDPNKTDSDDDGLSDPEELFVYETDPNDPDVDDDGLLDGDEVAEGTGLFDPDSDDDDLLDGTEVNTEKTDPLDRDTDGGGSTDGAEVLFDKTDPLDDSDDVCQFVDIDLVDASAPQGPDFDPIWYSVTLQMMNDANGVNDFWVDDNGDGVQDPEEEFSSALVITLYGPEASAADSCQVLFEADWKQSTELEDDATWTIETGSSLLEAYDIDPTAGVTDCGSLDANVYRTADIRKILDNYDWGVALGDLGSLESTLKSIIDDDPDEDWATDWAPYVQGMWITSDRTDAEIHGWAFTYEATCDEASLDADGALIPESAATSAPLENGLRIGTNFEVSQFSDLTGISCDEADVSVGDAGWTPDPAGPEIPDGAFIAVTVAAVHGPDSDIKDYYLDSDGDGVLEEFSSTLTAIIVDPTTFASVCTLTYDADGSVVEDIDNVTTVTGEVTYAWSIDLDEVESDCGEMDAALTTAYGTDNIGLLISLQDWVWGIGPMDNLETNGELYWEDDWADNQPLLHSEYISFDGGANTFEVNYGLLFNLDNCYEVPAAQTLFLAPAGEDGTSGLLNTTLPLIGWLTL